MWILTPVARETFCVYVDSVERAHKWIKLEAALQGNTKFCFSLLLILRPLVLVQMLLNCTKNEILWTELLVWGFAGALFLDQNVSKCLFIKVKSVGLLGWHTKLNRHVVLQIEILMPLFSQ